MNTALILIDIQNDYFPGGKMELEGSVEASERAARLLAFFRAAHLPRVHIQHVSTRPTATFFLPNTEGVRTHVSVAPREDETLFQKHYPNSFRDTPLLDHLRGAHIERVVIAGMMTHMCVDATTRAAFDEGFQCLIAGDACATRALTHAGKTVRAEDVHRAFLAALDGTYGKVMTAEEIIAQSRA
jgi:nicotinamidase-related amidase